MIHSSSDCEIHNQPKRESFSRFAKDAEQSAQAELRPTLFEVGKPLAATGLAWAFAGLAYSQPQLVEETAQILVFHETLPANHPRKLDVLQNANRLVRRVLIWAHFRVSSQHAGNHLCIAIRFGRLKLVATHNTIGLANNSLTNVNHDSTVLRTNRCSGAAERRLTLHMKSKSTAAAR